MKIFRITLIILTFSMLSCKQNSVSKPEDIGKSVFELLKGIDKKTVTDYNISTITYQELKDLVNNPEAKLGYYKANLKSLTPEQFTNKSLDNFNAIKDVGEKFNIDWDKIIYSDFKFEVSEFDMYPFGQTKAVKGETFFKNSDGKVYFIKSMSFYDGKGYKTIFVAEIETKRIEN